MARITVEDCIDKFPSRFELVLVASNRARKLHSGENATVDKDNDKNTVIALREIAQETITKDQLKNDLIEEYQTTSFTEDENLDEQEEDNNLQDNQEEIAIEDQSNEEDTSISDGITSEKENLVGNIETETEETVIIDNDNQTETEEEIIENNINTEEKKDN